MEDSFSHNLDNMPSQNNSATYVLRWKSALSHNFLAVFLSHMKMFDCNLNVFPLRILNWHNVHIGDVIYMVHEGEDVSGIVLRGIVTQEPHTYNDWCTEDSPSRLIALHVNQIMHPDKAILPDTSHIKGCWEKDEFKGHLYPILIDKQTAEELDDLFNSYLRKNKEQFAVSKNNGVAITDFEID